MDYRGQIGGFVPGSEQERGDQGIILDFIRQYPHNVLLRDNPVAHITSSGFIMNPSLDKVLLVHHNIRGVWAWTGGHADGNPDLLQVALQEAVEETGAPCRPLSTHIASLDILPVFGHMKKGAYVSAHLHLSVAYLLVCDEGSSLRAKPDENTGVAWFKVGHFSPAHFDASDVYLYHKLIKRAQGL